MSANWAQWWWWRFNGWGRVAASIGGGLAYIAIVLIRPDLPWWTRMTFGMTLATAFWIAATLLTAPERKDLLAAFYHRARPMGAGGPFRADGASEWAGVRRGILLAAAGAAAVMAYIVGLSTLYTGAFAVGIAAGAVAAILGLLFWQRFDPFVRSLLSAEEAAQLATEASAPASFGLAGLGAAVCGVIAVVLALQAVLTTGAARWGALAGTVMLAATAIRLRR